MWECSYRCEKSQYLSVFSLDHSFTKFFKRRKPIDHSPRKIGKHLTSEKKHVRKTEKPILPKWFTYTEWKVYDMGRFSRIWARVKDSSLAGLSGSNRRGWELIVEIIPPEHMNLRWGLNLVSLPDSSHVSTIGFSLFSGWRNKEGVRDYQLDNVGSIMFILAGGSTAWVGRGLVVTLGRFALGGSILPESIRSWMSCLSLKHFWPFVWWYLQ